MIIEAKHILDYSYEEPVVLNPQYLLLTPGVSAYQTLLAHDISISPEPTKIVRNVEQENNIQHLLYINSPLQNFRVESCFKVDSPTFNSLDFIFFPFECSMIPFKYPAKLSTYVGLALKQKKIAPEIRSFAQDLVEDAGNDTLAFLIKLTETIKARFLYQVRQEGDPQSPEFTLEYQIGSCRDFSVFMMEVCSAVGLMPRFVSGYYFPEDKSNFDLHGWVEILLPGGGWRGFDPTEGQVVDHRYIALARSIEPRGIVPLRGSFRSTYALQAHFESSIQLISM
ncbi:MAG: transglutaminase family protein [Leadbetterella sp.]